MGDNDFETLPPEIGELRNLQVVTAEIKIITRFNEGLKF